MSKSDGKPLSEGTLQEVVEVEQQIRAMLDAESARSTAWRNRRRLEIDEARRSEFAELESERIRQQEAAASVAAAKAAEIVRQARIEAERIAGLSDAGLGDIVWRHTARILPGRDQ